MSATSYVTLQQVKDRMQSSYDGSGDSIITNDIIPGCSTFLDTWTQRSPGGFLTQTYDELYHGTRSNIIYLRNAPIQSISRIAGTQVPAFWVQNTDSDMATRATVTIGTSSLTLYYLNGAVNSGNAITNTFSYSTYKTVSAMVAAINAAGNHWQAGSSTGMDNRLMNDIWAPQGAFGCRITTAYAWIYWFDLPQFKFDPAKSQAEVYSPYGFQGGMWNWRISYTAGYQTLPADLIQALCEMCVQTYYSRQVNPNVISENIGPMSYMRFSDPAQVFQGLSDMSRKTINKYRLIQVAKYSAL